MPKKIHALYLTMIIALLTSTAYFFYYNKYQPEEAREVKVYFNKDIKANQALIDVILNAERFVYFAIYTFTKPEIKDALLGAKLRGLEVQGIIDRKQSNEIKEQRKIVEELQASGIPIVYQNHESIMHLKTLVTDKEFVSGSYNWTASATERNDEVIETGRDESLRAQYEQLLKRLLTLYQTRS